MGWYVLHYTIDSHVHPDIWFGTHLLELTGTYIPRSNAFESFYSSCDSDYSFGFGYDYSTDDYNLKENTNRTIFKPKPIIEERTSDPKIKVATYVESLYSPDCNDWPDVGDQVLARKLSNVSIWCFYFISCSLAGSEEMYALTKFASYQPVPLCCNKTSLRSGLETCLVLSFLFLNEILYLKRFTKFHY